MIFRRFLTLLALVAAFGSQLSLASRILFVLPFCSTSHAIFYKALVEGLVKNNHTVRILSSSKIIGNGYRNLVHETLIPEAKNITMPNFLKEKRDGNVHLLAFQLSHAGEEVCEKFLMLKETMDVLTEAKKEPFDVILTGTLLYECSLPFAHILSIPRITVSSAGLLPWIDYSMRNPPQWSYVPNIYLGLNPHMNFRERFYNTIYSIVYMLHREWMYYPSLDKIVHKYLGSDIPSISVLDFNASLVLLNSDPSIDYPTANQPNVIQIGGLHLKSSQTIPKDMLRFMDESGDAGVVMFSMGSVLPESDLSKEDREKLAQAFRNIPQRVLWKWSLDSPPVDPLPDNILLSKWLPQQAVLAHKKIKALITHGGLGSCVEALYNGVPIIGLPIFADQEFNVKRAVYDGSGIYIDFCQLTASTLIEAIHNVTQDSRYRNAMLKRSRLLKDKLVDPVELGVYYVEHVIRHNGARHLRPAAADLSWFQFYLIDVILTILALLVFVVMSSIALTIMLYKIVSSKSHRSSKSKITDKYSKKIK